MRFIIAFGLSIGLAAMAWGQIPPAVKAAREYRQQHEREILVEFMDLLALPNVASDMPNIRRNAAAVQQMFERRGVKTQLLEVPDVPPVVYGEIKVANATRTLIVYAHYDGQPVEPQKWVGGEPFKPVLRTAMIEAGGKEIPLPPAGERLIPNGGCMGVRAAMTKRRSLRCAPRSMQCAQTRLRRPTTSNSFLKAKKKPVRRTSARFSKNTKTNSAAMSG